MQPQSAREARRRPIDGVGDSHNFKKTGKGREKKGRVIRIGLCNKGSEVRGTASSEYPQTCQVEEGQG